LHVAKAVISQKHFINRNNIFEKREREMARDWTSSKLNAVLRTFFTVRENIYYHLVKSFYGVFVLSELKQEIDLFYEYIELLGDSGKELKDVVNRYYDASDNILTENIDCLEFEYNRLFVGPALLIAPPYESVYRTEDHLVMGETTLDVRRAYREANLRVRETFKEPEDHIATRQRPLCFTIRRVDVHKVYIGTEVQFPAIEHPRITPAAAATPWR
jgi:Nitrate reductase delta subunit